MFESFTRLEETRNRAIEGTGLGMSIVIRLLDMMGSKLEVESEYGKGSEFSFAVDQMIIDDKPIGDFKQKAKEFAEHKENETYLFAPQARILVVDDNEMNLKVIKNLLKLNGIVPDLVESGEAALEKMEEKTYDIVLLDHMMPKMDGIETLEKAREKVLISSTTTVIALTANAVVGAKESYLKAGFDDYLSKPVEVKALEAVLAKYLPEAIVEYRKKHNSSKTDEKKERKVIEGMPEERRQEERRQEERRHGDRRHKDDKAPDGNTPAYEIFEFMPGEEDDYDEETETDGAEDMDTYLNDNGINTSEGLNYCGNDPDFYKEILGDYISSFEDRKNELDSALRSNDMSMYAIKVHALKSVAKTVGDRKVFEMALDLEMDSKAGNSEKVTGKHNGLIEEYEKKTEIVKKALSL